MSAAPATPNSSAAVLPPDAAQLRQLLQLALQGKGQHKARGWWQQLDFLLTRSHVDEDGDAFHDGLFISDWKRHDFWLALAGSEPPLPGHWPQRAWARLRTPRPPASADGLLCQWRAHDPSTGRAGPWSALDAQRDAAACEALQHAWSTVLAYWRAAADERHAGWPLRTQLHAALTPARVAALVQLPLFTELYDDWRDPQRAGVWLDELWVGARQAGAPGARRQGAALKLGWRNGQERAGDEPDDAHACYQIELLAVGSPPAPGTAHPPGLARSYGQRQSEPREFLPAHAAWHLQALLRLFIQAEARLLAVPPPGHEELHGAAGDPAPPLALPRLPPFAPNESDAQVLGSALMAASRAWQAAARAYASAQRERWQPGAADSQAGPPRDGRTRQAPAVLQLARRVQALGDADLHQRFRHRFTFAPAAYAEHAARHAHAVRALRWLDGQRLLAWVARDGAPACWQFDVHRLRLQPAEGGGAMPAPADARVLGAQLHGGAEGSLYATDEDGAPLWRHEVGGALLCLAAPGPHEPLLAVGTAGGYLVLLCKGAAPDPLLASTSRYHELARVLFWDDAPQPLLW